MKSLYHILLLAALTLSGFGQSLYLFDVDTTNYPKMKAKFLAFDKKNVPEKPNINEVNLTENGLQRKVTNITCPKQIQKKISIGIMVDTYKGIDMVRNGLANVIQALDSDYFELGMTYMDRSALIYQDFTNNKSKLLQKSKTIPFAPGVDVNSMFNTKYTGGIPFIKDRNSERKILVLITDLHCPNLNINESKLIDEAKTNNINIYSILLNTNDYSGLFKRIAKGTGGKVFEKVNEIDSIMTSLNECINENKYDPCEIEWESGTICDYYMLSVRMNYNNIKSYSQYYPSIKSIAHLKQDLNKINFGKVQLNVQRDTIINLFAFNEDILINNIKSYKNSNYVTFPNVEFPIKIPKNTSYSLSVRYLPLDSNYYYNYFEIENNLCPIFFSVSGGNTNKFNKENNLVVTFPNGNETFIVGNDTIITWKGISPSDTVTIEFSNDGGKLWKLITNQGIGFQYDWKNIPLPVSNKCLIRITKNNYQDDYENNIFLIREDNPIFQILLNNNEKKLITFGGDYKKRIWDLTNKTLLSTLENNVDYNKSMYLTKGDELLYVSDNIGKLMIWDFKTNELIKSILSYPNDLTHVFTIDKSEKYMLRSNLIDYHIDIIDLLKFQTLRKYFGHKSEVKVLEINGAGTKVASGAKDNKIHIWDFVNGKELMSLEIPKGIAYSLKFSPDDKYIAIGADNQNPNVQLWDAETGKLLKVFGNHNKLISKIVFSPDGEILASASADSTIKIWDVNSGKLIKTFTRHSHAVTDIVFSKNGDKIYSSSWDQTIRTWDLFYEPIQQDISDTLFSIIAPDFNLKIKNVDMGQVLVGSSKDTMVTAVFCNESSAPLHVLGVDVSSGDTTDFMVPRGAGEFTLAPGECRDLMFAFMPTLNGKRSAKITVRTTIGDFKDTINITGIGISPRLIINTDMFDFGTVKMNETIDLVDESILTNIGTFPIQINNISMIAPNEDKFAIISNPTPILLQPGDTAKIGLRFNPNSEGRYSGRLSIDYNDIGSPAQVVLFGNGEKVEAEPVFKPLIEIKSIQPNPASDYIEIYYDFNSLEKAELRITNILGQVVYSQTLAKAINGYLKIDARNFGTGQYFATFTSENIIQNYIIGVVR